MNKNNVLLTFFATVGYLAMIVVNFLANALPIGGVTTGAASDAYGNLFTPAGITFSIWGIIYILLLVYLIFQFSLIKKETSPEREELFSTVNKYFIISSLANIVWIFCWHYGIIWLSVVVMIVLLVSLIKIAGLLNKKELSSKDNICMRVPFSVYFGWITVATIANITVLLVSLNWDGFGVGASVWTVIILLVGAIIAIMRGLKDNNIPYILVLIWAYGGIWLKHISESEFDGAYPIIITVVIICIVSFLGTIGLIKNRQNSTKKISTGD